ncbi:hypothetical protein PHISCL_03605 [Aspergillus sclerotialis]|uniref:tyrosinase n=1 Tax=Aspergillus sclerotialis TaxID=2070753 RepID=A0A3A2ZLH4_9EURO|nr:hypothetical protein PHISCL_03605 [Aspergillus sclerotialis]
MSGTKDWIYYPITGIPVKATKEAQQGPNRKVPVRQNIDEWSSNPENEKQVKLFVMAMDRFQKVDPTKRESYFQIAGIHGQPNIPWDEPIDKSSAADKGYCTHNNILFPIWHRPYLILYEQRLYEIMVGEIIPNFPEDERAAWTAAANEWRLPFWDWGITNKVPKLCKYPTTVVPTADGKSEERIDNPLYQFKMPTGKPMGSGEVGNFLDPWVPKEKANTLFFGDCIGTSRWPDDEDVKHGSEAWKHGVVNNAKVEDALKAPQWLGKGSTYGQAAEMVYRLLTVPITYPTFATTAQLNEDVQNDINLEYIHNNVHGWAGGDYNGHMSQIPVATFDPLFWLHHCNIDRIFALWQALNPTQWFETGTVNDFFQHTIGMEDPKGIITPETPLRPFHRDTKGIAWTPTDARSTYDSGYTYPELQTWKAEFNKDGRFSQDLFLKSVRKAVNELYGLSRRLLVDADPNLKGVEFIDGGVKSLDFAFSIRYRKYAFGGAPFWIRLYFAQQEGKQDPTTDLITEVYNFSQKPESGDKLNCSNCKKDQKNNVKATAYVSVTPVLLNLIKSGTALVSLKREDVLAFLQKRAYWRVFMNGTEVPRYDVEKVDLEIIGSTNNATNWNDISKAPTLENFKKEPTLVGGGDGALDPALKQPVVVPPVPKPEIPTGTLPVNTKLPLKKELNTDGVILIDSARLNMEKASGSDIDNTAFNLLDSSSSDVLFHFSVRRAEGQIVFNTTQNGQWGKEVRISLENRFRSSTPSIMVHDQGDGFEVFIDWMHAIWFEKRDKTKKVKSISYSVNKDQSPVWSHELKVRVFDSFKELFNH